jgi:hypothetical protein
VTEGYILVVFFFINSQDPDIAERTLAFWYAYFPIQIYIDSYQYIEFIFHRLFPVVYGAYIRTKLHNRSE